MKKIAMTVSIMAGLCVGVSAGVLEYFEMNDASGTAMNGLANSGAMGSQWNFGGAGMATDGAGSLVLAGDGGTTTRRLPKKGTLNANATTDDYAVPLAGSDAYTLELTFAGWDLTAATVGDAINFKALDSAAVMVAQLQIEKDSAATARLRFASNNTKYRNVAVGLTGGSTKISVDFNMADGTSEYFLNDVSQYTFSGLSYAGNIGGLVFVKNGAWTTAASSVSIDSLGLSVVPEPATLGLIAAFGGGILVVRRRFMM